MGEKKGKKEGNDKKKDKDAGGGGGGGGEGKKNEKNNGTTVVLKMDMHCQGCADRIQRYAKSIDGVEKAKAEWEVNKLTVLGEIDPSKIRDDLQEKTKKKVELVSPQPKKEKKEKAEESNSKDAGNKKSQEKKSQEKKPKEPPVITAVFKLELHCGGCIQRIQKVVSKTKGVESVTIDKSKDLVTVTGKFDAQELADRLAEKMKRSVQVVPPKNDKDGGAGGGGAKKNDKKGGAKDEEEDEFDEDEDDYDDEYVSGGHMEGRRAEYGGVLPPAPGYGYPYGLLYGHPLHAPQTFSDENPNACSVM